jgi:hypothetical protein
MPADIVIPPNPPAVASCPGVPMPDIGPVVSWSGPPAGVVQAWAVAQLHYPLGTVIRDSIEGQPVICRIECHFKYGAHPEAPGVWHKGASIYRPALQDRTTGKLTALRTMPADWPSSDR